VNLNNIRIAAKLWLATGLIVLGLCIVVGYTAQRSAQDRVDSIAALDALSSKAKLTNRWAALTETNAARSQAVLLSSDPAVELGLKSAIAATSAQIGEIQKSIEATNLTAADRSQMETIAKNRKLVLETRATAMQQRADGMPTDVVVTYDTLYTPAMTAYQKSQLDFVAMQEQAFDASRLSYEQRAKQLSTLATTAILLLIAGILAGAAWLIRTIRQPLVQANDLAARIAQGDLSMQIDTSRGDEFGDLMKSLASMNQSLGRMVQQVRQSTDSIATASAEIASGNNDLAQRTEQTSSNLQSTASSMAQLTSTVQQSADNARQASTLAANASSVAEKGGSVVKQVVFTMEEINASSKKISDIIGVIDGIAFQTNILALNAAVEAARAGEQGRGFAVVASEVRSLAQRSAEAAKEIKMLIGTSVDKVASGTKLVSDAGVTMSDIVQSVRKVADVIGEITAASAEQSSGIAHVNQAIGNLDQMTQQNAALVEQSAAAAESLRDQASQMAQAVAVFKITETALTFAARPVRDITPRASALPYKRPQQLPTSQRAPALGNTPATQASSLARKPLALANTRAASPVRKPLSVAAPVKFTPAKPAPVAKQTADSEWESF
jgi:methyl-accepting chemotaxis protein